MKRGRRLHRFIENLVIGLAVLLFGAIVYEGIRRLPGPSSPSSASRPSGPPPLESSLPGAAPFGMSRTMPAPASLPAIHLSGSERRRSKPVEVPVPGQASKP